MIIYTREELVQALRNWAAGIEREGGWTEPVELRAAADMLERDWQPIETAPKDGTWVILLPHDGSPPRIGKHLVVRRMFEGRNGEYYGERTFTYWALLPELPEPASARDLLRRHRLPEPSEDRQSQTLADNLDALIPGADITND